MHKVIAFFCSFVGVVFYLTKVEVASGNIISVRLNDEEHNFHLVF